VRRPLGLDDDELRKLDTLRLAPREEVGIEAVSADDGQEEHIGLGILRTPKGAPHVFNVAKAWGRAETRVRVRHPFAVAPFLRERFST